MPFRKFFDRSSKRPAYPDAVEDKTEGPEQGDLSADDESSAEEGALPEQTDDIAWRARAAAVIANGASTGSKRPAALYGADDVVGPTHFSASVGCRVFDADGNE